MYFIVSHFTNNLGTTDYLLQYFRKKEISYLFLRHPFQAEKDLQYSELLYFNGKEEIVMGKYKKFNNFFIEMIRNYFLTLYCSVKYFRKYKKAIGFGGFNVLPILWSGLFGKITYFWGVDYSRKRFGNKLLDGLYSLFETLACIFSSKIISSSERQKQERIRFHRAKSEKSIVLNNGVSCIGVQKNYFNYSNFSFFFLGSISIQHGVLDFIEYFYINQKIDNKLYIIGGGEVQEQLLDMIKKYNLSDRVIFLGRKNKEEIKEFLFSLNEKIIGIAPYSDKINDHVYYGDSLKIREYLGYNIPFLVSDVPYVSEDIKKFGIIYNNFEDINVSILKNFEFDINTKNQVLEKYTWENIFSKEF